MGLPSGYKRLEYIESSGTQYIDTSVTPTNNTKIEVKGAGSFYASINGTYRYGLYLIGPSNRIDIAFGSTGYKSGVITEVDFPAVVTMENGVVTANGNTVTFATQSAFTCSGTLPLFVDRSVGTLYYCKIYDNGVLVRNFIPCLTDANVIGLWDDVNAVFYGNAGTGAFIAGPVVEYTKLEYIESTGIQYVDSFVLPDANTGYEIDFQLTVASTEDLTLMGSLNPNICFLGGNGKFEYAYKSGTGASGSFGSNDTLRHVWQLNYKNSLTAVLDQDSAALTAVSISNTKSVYIFASHFDNPVVYGLISARVFRVKISQGVELVRDYIPVQRQDGTVGLLDQVNNVFYTDAAGVGFVAGPVAAQPKAPDLLEVVGTTQNAVVLAWSAAPVGQNYRLYRDGVVIYEGADLHYTDTGMAADSTHTYSVHGVDGTVESEGVTAEATTTAGTVLITDRTAVDVSAGRRKGRYNALDLIRVGEAMAYLKDRFANVGISVSVSPKLDWQISDIPTQAQALHYLHDLRTLRGKLTEYRKTVTAPDSLATLTWRKANDIETILLDTEKLIQDIILSYRHYTGRAISGVNVLP